MDELRFLSDAQSNNHRNVLSHNLDTHTICSKLYTWLAEGWMHKYEQFTKDHKIHKEDNDDTIALFFKGLELNYRRGIKI